MRLGIISDLPTAYSPRRFQEEARRAKIEADLFGYLDLDFFFEEGEIRVLRNGRNLPDFGLVIFRSLRRDFFPQRSFLLERFKKQKVLNRLSFEKWPRLEQDKFTQHAVLTKADLPTAETKAYGSAEKLLEQTRNFPVVVKAFKGSHGSNVVKVMNRGELEEVLGRFEAHELLVQEVLPEGEDMRVIVIGNRAIGAMKRRAKPGKFVSNYSAGGRIENYPLEKDLKAEKLAVAATAAFNLEFCGVDLMKDKLGDWRVLEINRACQFEGFEKVTGVNVAKKTIDYLTGRK